MTQLGFYFDQTRCTGCYTCSVACKDWNDVDAGPASWMRVEAIESGKYPEPSLSYLASPCYHCQEPPCILACPEDAITKREADGIVLVDRDKCVGNVECRTLCRNACPWDSPQFGPEENAKMQKCDLCFDRLEKGQGTICVEGCPMYALEVGPLDRLKVEKGDIKEAEGFKYSDRFKPSVIFKPKKKGE